MHFGNVSFMVVLALCAEGCSAPTPVVQSPVAHEPAAPKAAVAATSEADSRAEALLAQMTLEEKLAYIGGDRDFYIRPIPRLKIPEIKFADGPVGCRNWGPSTAYAATVGLAASFDTALAERVGRAMARDCRARGVHVLLAPGANLQRSPLNGRNFEYFGEDPHLAGATATEVIKGVQAEGVLATIKHFAANNQEWDRNHVSSEVDERVLRELYFPAFEKAVREAKVGAVMSSYNLLNGLYASHHPWLLKKVLKQDWGFHGLVMSDWVAVHDPTGGALGGCDLEMPTALQMSPANMSALLDAGTVPISELDDKVRRILRTLIAAGFLDREQQRKDIPLDDPSSRAVALDGARESLVLLKNEGAILPLDASKVKTIALVGPNVHPLVHGGAGSAHVTPLHSVSVKDAFATVAPGVRVTYHPGIQQRTTFSVLGAPVFKGKVKEELFLGKLEGAPVVTREVDQIDFDPADGVSPAPGKLGHEGYSVRWTGTVESAKAGKYDVITNADDGIRVFVDGKKVLDDWSDHGPRIKLETIPLTAGKHAVVVEYFQGILGAIAQFGMGPQITGVAQTGQVELERVAAAADAVVLCLGYGQNADSNGLGRRFDGFWPPGWAREANLVESEDSDRKFALPEMQLETLKRVVAKNPRTIVVMSAGGGVELESWLPQVKGLLWAWYPGQEGGTAIVETLFGQVSPSGKLPITLAKRYEDHPSARYYNVNQSGKTPYTEGLLMGYRGFDANQTEPAFPFGFGLSYTSFAYSKPELVRKDDGTVVISFAIANTGGRMGAEVAQVYVEPPEGKGRPPQKLEGYARVSLASSTEQRVQVVLPPRAFAYWDNGWTVDAGRYNIHIASSSRERKLALAVELPAAKLPL
jgi:beta-glucosidase